MDYTATPETGPVDAPASLDSVTAEFEAGGDAPASDVESITQELVNEAEGSGDAEAPADAPATEDDATEATDEAEQPEESTPDEPVFTVKVNGEDITVSQSELLKGYSRTEDYKAKTMAIADERRALEAERSQVEARVSAEYANQLEQATNLFAQLDPVLQEAERIDWEALKRADPAAYLQAQEAVQARVTAFQQAKQQVEQAKAQSQQQMAQQAQFELTERIRQTHQQMSAAVPEFADVEKFKAHVEEVGDYLGTLGFTQDEVMSVLDARFLQAADKARKWDAHVAAQKALPEKKIVPKSAVKPLTTDGAGSRATPPRFPGQKASRDARVDWVTQQLLTED